MKEVNSLSPYLLRAGSVFTMIILIIACTTTRTPFNHTLVDSNRGTISISELTVENPRFTPGSLKRGPDAMHIDYPDMCWNSDIGGTVVLHIDIGDEGEVLDVKVNRGIGGGCDEAARRAFLNAEYEAARNPEGDYIEARHFVTVIFSR